MLIFVHIPKTAGTSFKSLLTQVFNRSESIIIDSNDWHKAGMMNNADRSQLPGSVKINPSSNIKYIVGHFDADRFINLYPDATYITWVRDPIQRLISQHNYYLRLGHYYGQMTNEKRKYDIIDLNTYCTHKRNINSMSQQLNIPLSKFKFIGITEKYEQEIERFKNVTGLNINNTSQYENINPDKKSVKETYSITDSFREQLMELHSKDYKLYNDCLQLAGY